jgi:hypothetical protein
LRSLLILVCGATSLSLPLALYGVGEVRGKGISTTLTRFFDSFTRQGRLRAQLDNDVACTKNKLAAGTQQNRSQRKQNCILIHQNVRASSETGAIQSAACPKQTNPKSTGLTTNTRGTNEMNVATRAKAVTAILPKHNQTG